MNPCFMKESLEEREIHYNLRVPSNIYARKSSNTAHGLETLGFLGQNLHVIKNDLNQLAYCMLDIQKVQKFLLLNGPLL